MTARQALRMLLWLVCLSHVAIGLGTNLVPGFVKMLAPLYGANVQEWSPQFLHIVRPLGAFMLALGAIAALAAMDPSRYRPVIYVFVGLFLIRCAHRIVFDRAIQDAFGISNQYQSFQIAFFLGLAILLVLLDQLAHRMASASESSSG